MSEADHPPDDLPPSPGVDRLLDQLEELEHTVDAEEEREEVRRAMRIARRVPGGSFVGEHIQKYTTRDMAETFLGGILISLPMLVEDGVFLIAEWFLATTYLGVPVYLVGNVGFVVVVTIGLLYWADIREVKIRNPIFGIVPRRLVGVLAITFLSSAFLMVLWGRHVVDDPTRAELFARVTVIWSAAAIGGALGDILPGESQGYDITIENLDDIVKSG